MFTLIVKSRSFKMKNSKVSHFSYQAKESKEDEKLQKNFYLHCWILKPLVDNTTQNYLIRIKKSKGDERLQKDFTLVVEFLRINGNEKETKQNSKRFLYLDRWILKLKLTTSEQNAIFIRLKKPNPDQKNYKKILPSSLDSEAFTILAKTRQEIRRKTAFMTSVNLLWTALAYTDAFYR